ncbi:hypothetical protein SAMN06265367_101368 [Algoriphagus winogradskyi]|jgi:hypothetical protein|uniref:Uncharacterized protein n=1 Tax=Algoriphagus winogradskyi TaxID=237017 RepID=A0ABY1NC35_9BACT|nr:hypothetical protein SAMN06265367_101368 [Algoriphagus winogradskyi]
MANSLDDNKSMTLVIDTNYLNHKATNYENYQ